MQRKYFLSLTACFIAVTLTACGGGGAKDQVSSNKVEPKKKVDHSKPAVGADVVGIKLGMKESEIRKKFDSEGWEKITDRKRLENIPGENPYEYAETLNYTREKKENGEYVYEIVGVHFVPSVKGDALARIITFDRRIHPQQVRSKNYHAGGKQVTSEFATSMLGVMKKKYGEPYKVLDGACTSYGGTTTQNIPIYEMNYYPNVRSYTQAGGMQIKIADTCQQSFSIRIEDQGFAQHVQNEFNEHVQKKLQKASSSTNRKVDF